MTDKETFNGECPYTGQQCKVWDCKNCEIELAEWAYKEKWVIKEEWIKTRC